MTKVRKEHLLQMESQFCHQQVPKLQLAQTERKFCPLLKPHGIECWVVPVCDSCGNYSSASVQSRQRATGMHLNCLSSHKAHGSCGWAQLLPGSERGKASLLPALCTEIDCAGPHGRKGVQSETINLHDLMQAGENNKKRKTLKTENRKLFIGSTGAIQEPKYKHRASFSVPEATWDIHTGMADLTLDLWKTCSLLEQQLGARCDTLRHQTWH